MLNTIIDIAIRAGLTICTMYALTVTIKENKK